MTDITLDTRDVDEQKSSSKIMELKNNISLWWRDATVVQKSALGALALVIVVGSVMVVISLSSSSSPPVVPSLTNVGGSDVSVTEPEEPKDQQLPLTGELVTKTKLLEITSQKVLSVVIENHPDARPQAGLSEADIVFETLVEGGITRFVGMFHSNNPEVIGPVRSVRKYFLDFIGGYGDPLFMHIGGAVSDNPEANALAVLAQRSVKSLGLLGGTFWRVSDRFAPHNAYSSAVTLREVAKDKGWVNTPSLYSWEYKDAEKNVENVSVPKVVIDWGAWGTNAWSVTWEFDSGENEYKRFHEKTPHTDALTGNQLTTRNVVVLYTTQALANDGTSRIVINTIGTGKALIFRDGEVIEGLWSKNSATDRYVFEDAQSNAIPLNRGNTWIMVVPLDSEVTY